MERVFFYILAVIIIVFAVMSVISRNIMRAIIYLLFVMIGIAGIYFMVEFNFLGAVQMTVYAGGIIILYINSVMLVEKIGEPFEKPEFVNRLLAFSISSIGGAMSLFAIYSYDFVEVGIKTPTTINQIGKALLSYGNQGYILPFEVISILLLAVMVGAIVIAKTNKDYSK